jgi:small subunit ribosomal protein S8e
MAFWHGDRGRKITGGKIKISRKKKLRELGNLSTYTKVGKDKMIKVKTKGGGEKLRLLTAEFANVFDKSSNSAKKVKILDVLEHKDNPQLTRSKIITKGTIIKTEIGNAIVTSRPSQHGIVNAVLLEEKK